MTERARSTAVAAGLGSAQLVAWGTLYYAIAVLGAPMRADLRLSESEVFGAFAWGLAVSGVLGPWGGRMIDRRGGRSMLMVSTLIGALAFLTMAHARTLVELACAWSIAGVAMSLGLYDSCFAAIGQAHPLAYRRLVTSVTLIAGFASTVSWPALHYLEQSIGWRHACEICAVALLACAPMYAAVLPRGFRPSIPPSPSKAPPLRTLDAAARTRLRILSYAFAGASLIGSAMSAHLPDALSHLHLPEHHAVWIASSIGMLQVLGRFLELRFGAGLTPTRLGLITFVGLALAMLLLAVSTRSPLLVYGFALCYGIANGLITIAKATLPVEVMGFGKVGAVLGVFGAPSLVARAFAPLGFALIAGAAGESVALYVAAAVALAALTAYASANRNARASQAVVA